MRVKTQRSFGKSTAVISLLVVFCMLMVPARSVHAATCETPPFSLDWSAIPWDETDVVTTEVPTFFDTDINAKNPYHGLATAAGGVDTFYSQTFADVDGNGTDMTIYYSANQADTAGNPSAPRWYGPGHGAGANPDERVTGITAARMATDRDADFPHPVHGNIATAASYVISFSKPILFQEVVSGSLSEVNGNYEHSVVRAFDDALAAGNVVKATKYNNISDLSDDSTLISNFGNPAGAVTNNSLTNVVMDPGYTYDANGVGQGVGAPGDDGIYHTVGVGRQTESRYGRVLLAWENDPLQSLAISSFVTSTADQSDDDYVPGPASTIIAPMTFCVAAASPDPDPGPGPDPDPTPTPEEQPGDGGETLAPTGQNLWPYIAVASSLTLAGLSVVVWQGFARRRRSFR